VIVAASVLWSEVLTVAAADRESDSSLPEPSGFALNADELAAIIDGKVVSSVLPKRGQHAEPSLAQSKHHSEGCPITDVPWMVHHKHLAEGPGWAVSKTDNKNFAYDGVAPE